VSKINKIFLNKFNEPYILAEAGVNHECSMSNAIKMIDQASKGGADGIKFQYYKAEKIASIYSPAYWDTKKEKTKTQFELFKKYDKFTYKNFKTLQLHCKKKKIDFLCTPFDFDSAKELNNLVDVFKISSSDITNKPFIEYISSFKKPIILSTGASNLQEIRRALSWIALPKKKIMLLHCILSYPTKNIDANLGMISDLQSNFPKIKIGYSDHTEPGKMTVTNLAFNMGCVLVEKHFTFNKKLEGNDHYHSADKYDLIKLRKSLAEVKLIMGSMKKKVINAEKRSRIFARRSIVAHNFISKNKKIKKKDLTFKRPGTGIEPFHLERVVGKVSKKNIKKDALIKFQDLS
jgi:sialic acid synthase SpsE